MAARHNANELDWDSSLSACAVGGGERRDPFRVPLSPEMKINSKALPFVLALAADKSARSHLKLALICAKPASVSLTRPPHMERKSHSPPGTAR